MRNCKEWLNTETYEYKQAHTKPDGEWVSIPDGAIEARINASGSINFINANDDYMNKTTNGELVGTHRGKHDAAGHPIVWQRDQDEPFLTPETTLNDQYADIEKVRQVEIHGTIKASQASGGVDTTLAERQTQYGCYEDVAQVTQQILAALRIGNYEKLPAPMKESLHMIASKMARIVNGDPEYFDNWHDIGGYAKLIEKLIKGE